MNTISSILELQVPRMVDAAVAYAEQGCKVFPLHSIVIADGRAACTCGNAACKNVAKHPRIKKRGLPDWGSSDVTQVRRWWRKWPDANIGLATGVGIIVVDIDNETQQATFLALAQRFGLTMVAIARTGRGFHVYFAGEISESRTIDGLLVRGRRSYVVAPPSLHKSGVRYSWVSEGRPAPWSADWQAWFEAGTAPCESTSLAPIAFGPKPAFLANHVRRDLAGRADTNPWSAQEELRMRSMLAWVDPDMDEGDWIQVLFAFHELSWGGRERLICLEWSQEGEKFQGEENFDKHWNSCGRRAGRKVNIGTILQWAEAAGWQGELIEAAPIEAPAKKVNGHHSVEAVAPVVAFTPRPIKFSDVDKVGRPKPTCRNARDAIEGLGLDCKYDVFHEKMYVSGQPLGQWVGQLADATVLMVRLLIERTYSFDPGTPATRDALEQLCCQNRYDPVLDYIDRLKWDGAPRLDSWVVRYLGTADTPYNRKIGWLMLIAAVRRARMPGCKFDLMVVLEGPQGSGKSSAIEILAGTENFSDQSILGHSDKDQQDATVGVWLYEVAELAGMHRAEIEKVKAFISRTHDRARPAYGRYRVDRPRRLTFWATTNSQTYLKDDTGNRRIVPLLTGEINLNALRRDRDQLWAEAAAIERHEASIALPRELWGQATIEQEERFEHDPWLPLVIKYIDAQKNNEIGFSSTDLLKTGIGVDAAQIDRAKQTRVGNILHKLGYRAQKCSVDKKRVRLYLPAPSSTEVGR